MCSERTGEEEEEEALENAEPASGFAVWKSSSISIGSPHFGQSKSFSFGSKCTDALEKKLVLREMPNGLKVWSAARAEEETFFIFGEVFEDRTYARMGIRVQDGDTVWDVGETDLPSFSCLFYCLSGFLLR